MARFALVQEHCPVDGLDGHGDAHGRQILLHALGDRYVTGSVVGEVFHSQRGAGAEHVVIVKLKAGSLQQLDCAGDIHFGRIVAVGTVGILPCGGIFKYAAVAVEHTGRNEGGREFLPGLADGINDVLAVNQLGERLAHVGSLLHGLAVEQLGLYVKGNIVGAQGSDDVELGVVLQGRDFICGNRIDEVEVALVVRALDGGIVIAEHELKLFDLHVGGIPVVGVLHIRHALVMHPALQGVSAVGNKASFQRPGAGVGGVVGSSFHSSLLYREIRREGGQVQHIGTGGSQHNSQGLAVVGSLHVQVVREAGDTVEHIAVVSSRRGGGGAFPAVFEVFGAELRAVAPFQTITHGEGIGEAVVADGVAGRQVGRGFALSVIGVQAGKAVGSQAGAVHRRVQRRVELRRLGGQVDLQNGIVAVFAVHKELRAIQVGVEALQVRFGHVKIIVIVQRHNCAGVHKLIFRLVHQGNAIGHIGVRFDLCDQIVVAGPIGLGPSVRKRESAEGQNHRDRQ